MKISYRVASDDDLDEIFQLVGKAIKQMECQNIDQWDRVYPTKEDFSHDIKKGELYIGAHDKRIAVVYAINKECDEQYKNGAWQYIGENFNVIHRLCVSPDFQRKGIAHATLLHIENELAVLGVKAIRLDVFSENPHAVKLYSNSGYDQVGVAHWRKGEFLLMEKLL